MTGRGTKGHKGGNILFLHLGAWLVSGKFIEPYTYDLCISCMYIILH